MAVAPTEFAAVDWLAVGISAALGTVMGGVGHLKRFADRQSPWRPLALVTDAAASGAAGFFALVACQVSHLSPTLTLGAIGLAGWMGIAPTLAIVRQRLMAALNPTGRTDHDPPAKT